MTDTLSTGLSIKDLVTLLISGASFVTSVTVATINIASQRTSKLLAARSEFDKSMIGINDARNAYERLRAEAGDKFGSDDSMVQRNVLIDRRNFHLSRCLNILKTNNSSLSSADYLLVAATLIESGRNRASVEFYRLAIETAADDFEQASARRVHGRALIASGNYEAGRKDMLTAYSEFQKMAQSDEYDSHRMTLECGETIRRLVAIASHKSHTTHREEDVALLRQIAQGIDDPARREYLLNTARQCSGEKSSQLGIL